MRLDLLRKAMPSLLKRLLPLLDQKISESREDKRTINNLAYSSPDFISAVLVV